MSIAYLYLVELLTPQSTAAMIDAQMITNRRPALAAKFSEIAILPDAPTQTTSIL